jgi:hypothetical protein
MTGMAAHVNLSASRPRADLADFSIVLVAGLALAFTAVYFCAVPLSGHLAGSRDFVSYWATGKQLVHGANPYDGAAVTRIEHSAGLKAGTLIMRNPPWALPLAWPLGFLPLRVAAALWSLLLLGCLLLSVKIVRGLHGSPPSLVHWLALAFTPALISLTMGQTSLLALLGLAMFLRFHSARPFAAGAALWLCALKPHLFLPFGAALLAWIVWTRAWKVLAGAVLAVSATSAAAFVLAPHAWLDYINLMRSPVVENEFVPCLGDALRHWLWPHHSWTRYMPAALACIWALGYFWKRRREWNWTHHASPLMLVSLLAAPYCFIYDQGLAIPAIMDRGYSTPRRAMLIVLVVLVIALDAELPWARVVSPLYLWAAPSWCGWYWLAGRQRARSTNEEIGDCRTVAESL